MPNWCENKLYINGPKQEIKKILSFNTEDRVFSFEWFDKCPDILEEITMNNITTIKNMIKSFRKYNNYDGLHISKQMKQYLITKYGYYNDYDWKCAMWGTKWDCADPVLINQLPTSLEYSFQTAWNAPENLIKTASVKYPNCEFTCYYFEPGMFFHGMFVYNNGQLIDNSESLSNKELQDLFGYEPQEG